MLSARATVELLVVRDLHVRKDCFLFEASIMEGGGWSPTVHAAGIAARLLGTAAPQSVDVGGAKATKKKRQTVAVVSCLSPILYISAITKHIQV